MFPGQMLLRHGCGLVSLSEGVKNARNRRLLFTSVALKWNGEAVWITASNCGFDFTASSKAPSTAMSSTMAKSSFSLGTFGWASLIAWALDSDRTVVTTE